MAIILLGSLTITFTVSEPKVIYCFELHGEKKVNDYRLAFQVSGLIKRKRLLKQKTALAETLCTRLSTLCVRSSTHVIIALCNHTNQLLNIEHCASNLL